MLGWAATYGAAGTVVLLDDLRAGDDVRGTELHGLDREVLLRALKVLEAQGKVRCAAMKPCSRAACQVADG